MGNSKTELRTFEDLECWKACRDLRRFAAMIAKKLPREEEYRLKDQILRAARSSTANIAEGYGRFHYQENIQYCRNARGSVYEVLDHFITGNDEELLTAEMLIECRLKVEKSVSLLNGYIRYLETKKQKEKEQE
jgi:four helix bundle protein